MGVSFYNCASCEEIFSDVGNYECCEEGHYFCNNCIDKDFEYDKEGRITNCQYCVQNELEDQEKDRKQEYEKNCFHINEIKDLISKYGLIGCEVSEFISELYELKGVK